MTDFEKLRAVFRELKIPHKVGRDKDDGYFVLIEGGCRFNFNEREHFTEIVIQ